MTPLGDLVATPERGLVFGNRGCLHDDTGVIRRRWAVRRWICCRLAFRGRTRPVWRAGRYTGLFFLDEATAWAAGHRPCAECRHADWRRFGDLWADVVDADRRADAIDARLHAERVGPDGRARLHHADAGDLPDGAFVLVDEEPYAVRGDRLLRWSFAGYPESRPRPTGSVDLITPPSLVAVLRGGWHGELPWLAGP